MTIVNEPRYQDFNGKVHKTEQECIHAEDVFAHKVFRILNELARGCKNQSDCNQCPFHDDGEVICSIDRITHNFPTNWNLEEEE